MIFTQSRFCQLKSLSAGTKSSFQQIFCHDDRIMASQRQSWLLWSYRSDKSYSVAQSSPQPHTSGTTPQVAHMGPFAAWLRPVISFSRIIGSENQEERIGQLIPRSRANDSDAIALMQPARVSGRLNITSSHNDCCARSDHADS